MRERVRIDDPYTKPWVARDAAKNVVRNAGTYGLPPEEVLAGRADIFRPDYNAVVGRLVGAHPPREIQPEEIGVMGFDAEQQGVVFSLAEIWQEVTGEPMPEMQAPLVEAKPTRRRKKA